MGALGKAHASRRVSFNKHAVSVKDGAREQESGEEQTEGQKGGGRGGGREGDDDRKERKCTACGEQVHTAQGAMCDTCKAAFASFVAGMQEKQRGAATAAAAKAGKTARAGRVGRTANAAGGARAVSVERGPGTAGAVSSTVGPESPTKESRAGGPVAAVGDTTSSAVSDETAVEIAGTVQGARSIGAMGAGGAGGAGRAMSAVRARAAPEDETGKEEQYAREGSKGWGKRQPEGVTDGELASYELGFVQAMVGGKGGEKRGEDLWQKKIREGKATGREIQFDTKAHLEGGAEGIRRHNETCDPLDRGFTEAMLAGAQVD